MDVFLTDEKKLGNSINLKKFESAAAYSVFNKVSTLCIFHLNNCRGSVYGARDPTGRAGPEQESCPAVRIKRGSCYQALPLSTQTLSLGKAEQPAGFRGRQLGRRQGNRALCPGQFLHVPRSI